MSTLKHLDINGVTYDIGVTSLASTVTEGLMSSSDKQKLDSFNSASCYSTLQNLVDGSSTGSLKHKNASATIGNYATAIGYASTASGTYSFAEGRTTKATGNYSHVEGYQTLASTHYAHAEGDETKASGLSSHAEGYASTASGQNSHAEGQITKASGLDSHAEGYASTAAGKYSHTQGYYTIAGSTYQHVEGKYNIQDSSGTYAHIVGNGTSTSARSNAYTLDWSGNGIYAGKLTVGSTGSNSMDIATVGQLNNDITRINTQIGTLSTLTSPSTVSIVNAINSINILHYGEQIPANANLDNYTENGTYYCEATNVQSISNLPGSLYYSIASNTIEEEGFKLIVSQATPQQIKQQLVATATGQYWTGAIWFRYGDDQQAWADWHRCLTVEQTAFGDYLEPYDPQGTANLPSSSLRIGFRNLQIMRQEGSLGAFRTQTQDLTLGSPHNKSFTSTGGLISQDSAGKTVAYVQGGIGTDGVGFLSLQARNSSSNINRLSMFEDENGTERIDVSSPSAWRTALDVPKADSSGVTNASSWRTALDATQVPTKVSIAAGTTKSLASGSNGNVTSYTFTPGVWILNVHGSFASSSVGRRAIFLSTSSTGGSASTEYNANKMAVNGATTVLTWTAILNLASSTKYYFNAYQNSGSANTLTLYASAIKLSS